MSGSPDKRFLSLRLFILHTKSETWLKNTCSEMKCCATILQVKPPKRQITYPSTHLQLTVGTKQQHHREVFSTWQSKLLQRFSKNYVNSAKCAKQFKNKFPAFLFLVFWHENNMFTSLFFAHLCTSSLSRWIFFLVKIEMRLRNFTIYECDR